MKLSLIISILMFFCAHAQSFSDYRTRYDNYEEDDPRAFEHIKPYIAKAKKEGAEGELVQAYKDAVSFSPSEKLLYSDSMILTALKTGSPELAARAYLTKGTVYYFNYRKFQPALDEFLKAWRYSTISGDPDLYYKNLYYIGVVKSYLGYFEEALKIFHQCNIFFKEKNLPSDMPNLSFNRQKGYLNTLHQTGICLTELGHYREASEVAALGLRETVADADFYLERSYFYKLKGIILFKQRNFREASEALNNALPGIFRKDDYANASLIFFYKGLIDRAGGSSKKQMSNFVKIDSVFRKYNFILPEIRPAYEYLIKEAASRNDYRTQLYYTSQLLKADRVIATDFKYLSGKIYREYDTSHLEAARRRLEISVYRLYIFAGIVGVSVSVLLYWFRTRAKNKLGIAPLTVEKEPSQKAESVVLKSSEQRESVVSDTVMNDLLSKIDRLERENFFLHQDMTLAKMAKILKTNTAYLSSVINEHKKCNFKTYINRLRICYVTQMLAANRKWRKYTISTLANDAGFSQRSTFSQAFIQYHGITPGAYINKLGEDETGASEEVK